MKKLLIFFVLSMLLGSCKKYMDVNTNPNTPTVTRTNYVFSNALNVSGRIIAGGLHITGGTWAGYYGHSTSFTGGGQEKTYVFTNGDFNFFDGLYDNLTDYQYVITHAEADGLGYMIGPSKVMQCLIMQKIVDIYGDVPYSEALLGTEFITPKYDDAATIYNNLVAKLTEATADINAASFPSSDPSDIYFNANKTRWKQLANTIKMRLIVRRSQVSGYNPSADLATLSSDGIITTPVLCNPGYTKTAGKLNPYYQNWGFNENDAPTGDFRKMSAAMINWLKSSNDLFRLQRMCAIKGNSENLTLGTSLADFAGVPLGGDGSSYLSSNVSAMGSMQIVKGQANRSLIIMTDAEAAFLKAEAVQRGWLPGDAKTAYEDAVKRSFNTVAGTYSSAFATATADQANAAATAYLASGLANADWNASTDKLKAIWVQKWVALCNIDGGEAWAEYRRTNSTSNPTGNAPTSVKSVATGAKSEPVRFFYPLRESNVNSSNVPTGIDVFTSRIFWDVN